MKLEHRIDMKWIVKSENLIKNDVYCDFIETTIPGINYRVSTFCTPLQAVSLLLVIRTNDDDERFELDLTVSIPSANKTFPLLKGYKNIDTCFIATIQEIMNKKNGYLVDGTLIICLKGTIKKQIFKRKYPFEETSLGSIMCKKSKKDFTFVIGDKSVMVHKAVMAGRSKYFEAMFSATWKENVEGKAKTNFEYPIVEKAVNFCYDFPLIIDTEDEAISLLEFSDYYDIKTLKHEVENWLTEKISAENVCDFANASVSANSRILQNYCINFLIKCLKDSTPVDGIDGLDADLAKKVLKHSFCITHISQYIRDN